MFKIAGCLVLLLPGALTEAAAEATAGNAVEEIGLVLIPGRHFQGRDLRQEGDHPATAEVQVIAGVQVVQTSEAGNQLFKRS
jgi:hypothetical protein